ncbi:MAG: bifunctional 4-hydroxy-2-oxoglutarate aldolase/2-dehydro-3-deoxy-phosphogluconate aldolase [Actinobacteria bacterium]|nr:bifunctional 4-hydroxy-2-oxoglutarate aldolase/2-dehydro-3-deoxy-phosphogluconate aldolase [Actinomycetota bacterium]
MEILGKNRVIPVLVIEDASWASELGKCLLDSGVSIVEVTLRTDASWQAIETMKNISGLIVGMGSVSKEIDLDRGKDLGVEFAVSAGLRNDLVLKARALGIPYLPGVATPSEVLSGIGLSLEILKWFPAETLGGISALKAISAPFPKARFIPTGGITQENAGQYLQEKSVLAVGGSWMFPKSAMSEKNLPEIARLAAQAARLN